MSDVIRALLLARKIKLLARSVKLMTSTVPGAAARGAALGGMTAAMVAIDAKYEIVEQLKAQGPSLAGVGPWDEIKIRAQFNAALNTATQDVRNKFQEITDAVDLFKDLLS